jgi:hypothetical protein
MGRGNYRHQGIQENNRSEVTFLSSGRGGLGNTPQHLSPSLNVTVHIQLWLRSILLLYCHSIYIGTYGGQLRTSQRPIIGVNLDFLLPVCKNTCELMDFPVLLVVVPHGPLILPAVGLFSKDGAKLSQIITSASSQSHLPLSLRTCLCDSACNPTAGA